MVERRPFEPRPYQALMLNHMLEAPRCAVWAGMGLGKTSTALTALDLLHVAGEDHPDLVLAPLRVARSTWPAEASKWEHLRQLEVVPITGSEAERTAALKRDRSTFSINYENLPWLVDHFGGRWPYRTVVSDESTRLKSMRPVVMTSKLGNEFIRVSKGKRARQLARLAHTNLITRFIELTGTPSPNGLQDLWGQMWFIDAGRRLGRTFEAFTQRWFRPKANGYGVEPLPFAQEQIQEALRDVCISINAADWFDLDEPIVNNIYVDLPAKAMRLYRDMEKEMFASIEGHDVEAFNAASRTMKCLQLANGAAYVDEHAKHYKVVHDAKLDALDSIVAEAAGMPVLVAYHFRSDLERILKAFPKARHLDADPKTEDAWNAGDIPMLVAHPKSAGHGLNLQDGGNIVAHFGHWWDLELYQQINERLGPVRQAQAGHKRPVFHYHILARDTVDELVMLRREGKRAVQDILLDAMKARGLR